MVAIANSYLDVFPLCLGGSVFGWTVDEETSFRILDAYVEAGGNFIDTADSYSQWAPGNSGGESESVIGSWLASRSNRDRVLIATKVGRLSSLSGLSAKVITRAVEGSLRRLGTDRIDLYYAHADDADTPFEETLAAFEALISAGKVRHIAASNISGPRLSAALDTSRNNAFPAYVAVQPPYNLMERDLFESELAPVCARERISCIPYFALAQGFLTGKYRDGAPTVVSVRRAAAQPHSSTARGKAVLAALDSISADRGVTPAAVALAWLTARPHVASALSSSRTPEQLAELLPGASLELSAQETDALDRASRVPEVPPSACSS
jgi:aryl-alcohol dehydrogenase-like predicted oxidoreductase